MPIMKNFDGKLPILNYIHFSGTYPCLKGKSVEKGPCLKNFESKADPNGWKVPVRSPCYLSPPPLTRNAEC